MKTYLTALALALAVVASPVLAQNVDMSSMTPTLTYPKPATEPASQNISGVNN